MLGAQQPCHAGREASRLQARKSRKQEITKAHRSVRGRARTTAAAPEASTTWHQKKREHGQHHGKMRTTICGRQGDGPQRGPGPKPRNLWLYDLTWQQEALGCDQVKGLGRETLSLIIWVIIARVLTRGRQEGQSQRWGNGNRG